MMEEGGVKAAVVARVVTMIVALNWTMIASLLYDMCSFVFFLFLFEYSVCKVI